MEKKDGSQNNSSVNASVEELLTTAIEENEKAEVVPLTEDLDVPQVQSEPSEPVKRGRGRPRKNPPPEETPAGGENSGSAEAAAEKPVKRGRGRPRKNPLPEETPTGGENSDSAEAAAEKPVKRGRGRPRKNPLPEETPASTDSTGTESATEPVKRGRGRPRKNPLPEEAPAAGSETAAPAQPGGSPVEPLQEGASANTHSETAKELSAPIKGDQRAEGAVAEAVGQTGAQTGDSAAKESAGSGGVTPTGAAGPAATADADKIERPQGPKTSLAEYLHAEDKPKNQSTMAEDILGFFGEIAEEEEEEENRRKSWWEKRAQRREKRLVESEPILPLEEEPKRKMTNAEALIAAREEAKRLRAQQEQGESGEPQKSDIKPQDPTAAVREKAQRLREEQQAGDEQRKMAERNAQEKERLEREETVRREAEQLRKQQEEADRIAQENRRRAEEERKSREVQEKKESRSGGFFSLFGGAKPKREEEPEALTPTRPPTTTAQVAPEPREQGALLPKPPVQEVPLSPQRQPQPAAIAGQPPQAQEGMQQQRQAPPPVQQPPQDTAKLSQQAPLSGEPTTPVSPPVQQEGAPLSDTSLQGGYQSRRNMPGTPEHEEYLRAQQQEQQIQAKKLEQERLQQEQLRQRREQQRLAKAQADKQRAERLKVQQQRQEQIRLQQEKLQQARLQQEQARSQQELLRKQQLDQTRLQQQQMQQQQLRDKQRAEQLAARKAAQEKARLEQQRKKEEQQKLKEEQKRQRDQEIKAKLDQRKEERQQKQKEKESKQKEKRKVTVESLNTAQAKRRRRRRTSLLGLFVVVLVVVGVATFGKFLYTTAVYFLSGQNQAEEYQNYVAPVVLMDPGTFGDPSELDPKFKLQTGIWSLVMNGNSDRFDHVTEEDKEYILVPVADIESEITRLFGESDAITHKSFGDEQFMFFYDGTTNSYKVPVTARVGYSPKIEKIEKDGGDVKLYVGYIPANSWQSDSGNAGAIKPEKTMIYTISKKNKKQYIKSVQPNTGGQDVQVPDASQNQGNDQNNNKKS